MRIRQLDGDEDRALGLPLQTYAFRSSPNGPGAGDYLSGLQPYLRDNLTLAVEDGDRIVAQASAIPMRQDVRGLVVAMAGVAGVASHPLARRQGHVRTLLTDLLGRMRDSGCAVSALHPFRPSFYQRFGYAALPKSRTVRLAPDELAPLLRLDLPGEVTLLPVAEGYDNYRGFLDTVIARQHGFAVLPEGRTELLRNRNDRWLVTAYDGGEVVGMTYHVTGFGGQLITDDLLTVNALGRTLLLRFFAHHEDQVATVVTTVGPAELPELWLTDLQSVAETAIALPHAPPPMARVLSLDALSGMPVGPGRVAVQVVDDPFVTGSYLLDGGSGNLEVSRRVGAAPTAVLTAVGLSGLLFPGPGDVGPGHHSAEPVRPGRQRCRRRAASPSGPAATVPRACRARRVRRRRGRGGRTTTRRVPAPRSPDHR